MARPQVALGDGSACRAASRQPGLSLLAALGLLAACSDPPKHAPLIDPCGGTTCPNIGQIGQGIPGSGGASSSGGGSGLGGVGGVSTGVLRGNVVDLVDDTFRTSLADTQPAVVEAQGASQPLVSAEWNGIDAFELKGVQTAISVSWVSVRPKNGNSSLRTLTPVSLSLAGEVALPMVQADVIDGIFQGLSTASTRSSGAAQLVVSFISTKSGFGAPGVKVAASSAALVAYRNGGVWSTDVFQTDNSGLVMVGNLAAATFPGTPVTLTLSGVTTGSVSFTVASDAVSLAELRLSL
ncbi:MAG: hypothetical protein QM756_44030 [Polyangiaceae bacterium]